MHDEPPNKKLWYENKQYLLPFMVLLPAIGTAFLWATPWPKRQKFILSAVAVCLFFVRCGAINALSDQAENKPEQAAQIEAPIDSEGSPEEESEQSEPIVEAEPVEPLSSIKPEHRDLPTFINTKTNQEYFVLTEPIGSLGQLKMQMVSLESEGFDSVVTNCIDFQRQGKGADVMVGNPSDPQGTIGDWADWFSDAIASFCDDWEAPTTATAPTAAPEPESTPLPETDAMLISEDIDSRINVRRGPGTNYETSGYGLPGNFVKLLAQSQATDGYTWFQVRFEDSQHVAWVRGDFVTTEIRTAPQQQPQQTTTRQPVRSPVSGSCDCPYDTTSNGSQCGGRSAYSKPGGSSPICYTTD